MSATSRRPVLVGVFTVLLSLFAAVGPAKADVVARLDAGDNVEAAIAWSTYGFTEAGTVLLGRDDLFADSLSSGSLQGLFEAPLLLTPPTQLDERTAAEIDRLGASRVVILGGMQAISQGVEDDLDARGLTVERAFGADRIGTAIDVARTYLSGSTSAVLVRAYGDHEDPTRAFADSLAAGAYAAATTLPVLFTATEGLSAATAQYLTEAGITSVLIVGGVAAVSEQVEADLAALGVTVDRAAGDNRDGTAFQLALRLFPEGAPPRALVVEGSGEDAWASGFPAAAVAAAQGAVVLLSHEDDVNNPTTFGLLGLESAVCGPYVNEAACDFADVATSVDFGGPGTISAALIAEDAPGGGDPSISGGGFVLPTKRADALCFSGFLYTDGPVTLTLNRGDEVIATIEPPIPFPIPLPGLTFDDCLLGLGEDVVADIVANPPAYNLTASTAEFPAGAIRGTLYLLTDTLSADLGEPEALVGAEVQRTDDPTEFCGDVFYLAEPPDPSFDAARIEDAAGSVLVELTPPDPAFGGALTCVRGLDPALIDTIFADPGSYFVAVSGSAQTLRAPLFDPAEEGSG